MSVKTYLHFCVRILPLFASSSHSISGKYITQNAPAFICKIYEEGVKKDGNEGVGGCSGVYIQGRIISSKHCDPSAMSKQSDVYHARPIRVVCPNGLDFRPKSWGNSKSKSLDLRIIDIPVATASLATPRHPKDLKEAKLLLEQGNCFVWGYAAGKQLKGMKIKLEYTSSGSLFSSSKQQRPLFDVPYLVRDGKRRKKLAHGVGVTSAEANAEPGDSGGALVCLDQKKESVLIGITSAVVKHRVYASLIIGDAEFMKTLSTTSSVWDLLSSEPSPNGPTHKVKSK